MRITAVVGHVSGHPDPVSFSASEVLRLGTKETTYPGWVWVTASSGKAGWAPDAYLEHVSESEARAIRDYTARELDTRAGESLTMHLELDEWLWVENAAGERGWIPKETTDAGTR